MTPAVKRKRRQDPRQTTFEFRPTGRGGARPGAGRKRARKSRVPHRTREAIPRRCPVLVTLRVEEDVPPLRRGSFARAFRDTLRQGAERAGFRVVHYSLQDNHAHFLVEADDKEKLANGMKSIGARFARCVNRVFGRRGRVLATRFHHVVKRTPTEVRNALAYVLLKRPQALPGAPGVPAARGAGRGELGALVRRLGDVAAGTRALRGRRPRPRGGGTADVAPRDGLAAGRADRSRGGAGVHQAPTVPESEVDEEAPRRRPHSGAPPASATRTTPAGFVHASSTVPIPQSNEAQWATGWATPPYAAGRSHRANHRASHETPVERYQELTP